MRFTIDSIIDGKHNSIIDSFLFDCLPTEFFDKKFPGLKRVSGNDQDVIEYEGELNGKEVSIMVIGVRK